MLDQARAFLAARARVLDRRRFERLFEGGPADAVRAAVAAYANPDGGFGHALEPDGRAPGSQPAAVMLALGTLHGADAWDDGMACAACDWLTSVEPDGGGVPFVLPSIETWPAAPWWQVQPGLPASLTTTGPVAAALLARAVDHPWVDRAVAWLWDAAADAEGEYDLRGAVAFLGEAPDRERAATLLRALAPRLAAAGLGPLAVAPLPGQAGRVLFDDAQVAAALDDLAAGQRPDGGWDFAWPAWSPAATAAWRGSLTVDALAVLRANGRDLQ
jgi:hypothetical protein